MHDELSRYATPPCPGKRHPGALCRRHRRWLSNGGNITIEPRFVVLDHSSIIAQAIEDMAAT